MLGNSRVVNALICSGVVLSGLCIAVIILSHPAIEKTKVIEYSSKPQENSQAQTLPMSKSISPLDQKQIVSEADVYSTILKLRAPQNNSAPQIAPIRQPSLSTIVQPANAQQRVEGRIVIMKNGERYYCRRVLENRASWSLWRTDGKISTVKKDDVDQLIEPVTTEGIESVR